MQVHRDWRAGHQNIQNAGDKGWVGLVILPYSCHANIIKREQLKYTEAEVASLSNYFKAIMRDR
jgi:hypothetical protein